MILGILGILTDFWRKVFWKAVRDKVKVRLFLCLSKYHVMKTYPVLNLAPCHEVLCGSGGTAPLQGES
jgi:hypothetical protein